MQIFDDEIVFKRGRPRKGEVRPKKVEVGYCPTKRRRAYDARVRKERSEVFTGRTYGEAWWEFLNHPDYFKGDHFGKTPPRLPKRMSYHKAVAYYTAKLQRVWDALYPVKPNDFLKGVSSLSG